MQLHASSRHALADISVRSMESLGALAWDDFCEQSEEAWFWHSSQWINCILILRPERKPHNHSFALIQNHRIVAIVPLIELDMRGYDGRREFSFLGQNTPFPAFADDLEVSLKKRLALWIFESLKAQEVDYITMSLCPLLPQLLNKETNINPLLRHDFWDSSLSTQIIDLEQSEDLLFKDMRKGHRADVRFAQKSNWKLELIHGSLARLDQGLSHYRDLHFKAAGFQAWSDATWELMKIWLEKDLALLSIIYQDEIPLSGIFINLYKKKAYYHSSATHPDFASVRGLGHLLQWESMRFLKAQEVSHYEMGWNWYASWSQEIPDLKKQHIGRYKRGFGGQEYPLFRAEYFKDPDFLHQVLSKRLENHVLALKELSKEQD